MRRIIPTSPEDGQATAAGERVDNRRASALGSLLEYVGNINTSLSGLRAKIPESVTEVELLAYNFWRSIVWGVSSLAVFLAYKKLFSMIVISVVSEEIRNKTNFKLVELCIRLLNYNVKTILR